ncbi:hypothetical protein [Sedimentibacter sp.]|uniref:AbiJ-related protein n=1 Tax=Sedimentibacter sp. TaxID=1960295 RepID=UPI002897D195|nr:hypothetical protein [Sedimentibacter sp.]
MNRITEITKRDIMELFKNGLEIDYFFDIGIVTYRYFGRLEEIDFLKRIYDLEKMPSHDSRYKNAEIDIWKHTVNNDDYPPCWVFEDERFQLQNGSDEIYLKFICEIFHPAVRNEKGYWKEFLTEVNKLLQNDGYELYPAKKISNREVYAWRVYKPEEEGLFIPYSQRNLRDIREKKISLSINRKARNQIYKLLEKYNVVYQHTDETGWDYNVKVEEDVFNDIRQFYIPKCYNEKKQYIETDSLENFILYNSPFYVMDAIEFFERNISSDDFEMQINAILRLNEISLKLDNGRIVSTFDNQINKNSLNDVQEVGLKELLQEAGKYYDKCNYQIAVEKLWDAFERLKTYYSPTLDKKDSSNKIVQDMGNNKQPFMELFEKEFRDITYIGNNFRIRHHETTKIDIEDERHYEYFYKRCLSLILIAIQYLDGK